VPVGRLVLYAWSPLVVSEICVSGHVDALVVPLALATLLAFESGRPRWAGAAIGAAALLKLYPALLVLAAPRGARAKTALAAFVVAAVGYAPYAALSGTGVLGFLPDYFRSGEDFNHGLRALVQAGLEPLVPHARQVAMALCGAALACVLVAIARRGDEPVRSARGIVLAFLLLLPTAIHPWYGLWLAPLVVLRPHPAGIWLVGALPLSYLKYAAPAEQMPLWVLVVEWLPAWALFAAHAWATRARGLAPS